MPCYSDPHDYCDHANGKCNVMAELFKDHFQDSKILMGKINSLTDMLCRLLTKIEISDYHTHAYMKNLDDDIDKWWKNHKQWDVNRNK